MQRLGLGASAKQGQMGEDGTDQGWVHMRVAGAVDTVTCEADADDPSDGPMRDSMIAKIGQ